MQMARVGPWGIAAVAALLAVALRPLLLEAFGDQTPYLLAVPAVVVIAAICGRGPALLTAALSIAGVAYAVHANHLPPTNLALRTAFFLGISLPLIWLVCRARDKINSAQRALAKATELEREGARLREAMRAYVENTEALAWLKNERGQYVFMNNACAQAMRSSPSVVVGKTDRDIVPAEVADQLEALDARVRAAGTISTNEVVTFDDRVFRIVRFLVPLADGSRGVGGTAIDITESVRNAERAEHMAHAAVEREDVLRSVLDNVPEGITVAMGDAANIVLVSRYGIELLDKPLESLVGITAEAHPQAWQVYDAAGQNLVAGEALPLSRACRGERIKNEALTIRCRDGTLLPILCDAGPIVDTKGNRVGGVIAWRDISELRRVEQQAFEASKTLDVLLNNTPLAVVMWDRNFRVTRWSGLAERMFGWSAEEVVGRELSHLNLVHPDDEAKVASVSEALLHSKDFVVSKNRNLTKSGETLWCEWHNSVTTDSQGEMQAVLSLVLDVTRRELVEKELRLADERKNGFIATLAHELRNPLSPIRNAAAILTRPSVEPHQVAWAGALIERQMTHLTRLLDDLLDVARVSHGRLELKRQAVVLQDLLREAVEQTSSALRDARQQLVLDLAEAPIYVDGDPARLVQVFANLLSNAAKYASGPAAVRLSLQVIGPEAVVTVADSGIGIPQEQRAGIFELFFRAESPEHRLRSGLGLGLSIVRSIVQMHGGTVSVESEGLNRGAEFTVRLPRIEPEGGTTAAAPAAARSERLKVLVVDDALDNAVTLGILLETLGHQVEQASTGDEAISRVVSFAPDLLLLDLALPDMSGYDVLAKLKARVHPMPYTAALTGFGSERDRQLVAEAGFDAHLVKPAGLTDLINVVEAASRQRRKD